MSTTRSATSKASSWSWVTKTLVTWSSSWSRRSQRRSSWRTRASSAPKGSSRSSTLGLGGQRPGQRHPLPLAAGELVRVAPRRAPRAGPGASSSFTRAADLRAAAACGRGARRRRSRPPSCGGRGRSAGRPAPRSARAAHRPWHGPRRRWRTSPASGASRPARMRRRVVLPQPEGPSSAVSSPPGSGEAHVAQHRLRARRTCSTPQISMLMPRSAAPARAAARSTPSLLGHQRDDRQQEAGARRPRRRPEKSYSL